MFKNGKPIKMSSFPTPDQFERNKVQLDQILKWPDVPTEVIYRIEKVEWIRTKVGDAMVVSLVNKNGEKHKAFQLVAS